MPTSFQTPHVPDVQGTTSTQHLPHIALIGWGRVGSVLGRALHAAQYPLVAVASRNPAKAEAAARLLDAHPAPPAAAARQTDLVLLAVPDAVLPVLAQDLAAASAWRTGQYVVHTSGALPASALQPAADHGAVIGSFHPLAAFADPNATLPLGITFGIEAPAPLQNVLVDMARALGGYPLPLTAAQKPVYHAAAVLASNYTVTLAALASQLFDQLGVAPTDALCALVPLMRTTLGNLEQLGLPDALTGPLVRGDVETVQRHLEALDQTAPHVATVYRCLGQATWPLAQQRGLDPASTSAFQDLLTLPTDARNSWEQER